MNLFATDENPVIAAQHLDDIRLNKMITESCQMLVMSLVQNGLPQNLIPLNKAGQPYKTKGHSNHPITKWTASGSGNFAWHAAYLGAMLQEYHHRTGKTRTGMNIYDLALSQIGLLPTMPQSPFHNSSRYTNNQFQDVVYCYRQTMIDKWLADKIVVKWTKRKPPAWSGIQVVKIGEIYYKFTEKEEANLEEMMLLGQAQT